MCDVFFRRAAPLKAAQQTRRDLGLAKAALEKVSAAAIAMLLKVMMFSGRCPRGGECVRYTTPDTGAFEFHSMQFDLRGLLGSDRDRSSVSRH